MLALAACGSDEPAPSSQAAAAASGPSYARDAMRDNWPPLPEAAAPAAVADSVATSNYYVVLDGSGSMLESECSGSVTKIEAAVASLGEFVKLVPEEANLGLVVFDGQGISERVPLGTGNRDAFLQALAQTRADGGTPLRTSITLGYDQLVKQGQRQLGYGDYHLVVVTDGVPDPSSEDPRSIVQTISTLSPVVLHTIGFCIGSDHVLNQPGRSYYVAADSPQQLAEGLGAVLAEAPSFDVVAFGSDD
ncbi:MAG: vWA domain-containing protein [Ilumatobacteraceae bacterium]